MNKLSASQAWSPRLALLVAATFFMEFLDGTVLTTAIPEHRRRFWRAVGQREHHHDRLPDDGGHGHPARAAGWQSDSDPGGFFAWPSPSLRWRHCCAPRARTSQC